MAKTYKTDPYLIRAYRHIGQKAPADWRERWKFAAIPHADGELAIDAWLAARPRCPDWNLGQRDYPVDKRNTNKRMRMAEREGIAHERYDAIPTRTAEVDFDWW